MLRLFKSLMVFMLVFSQFPAISIATENNEATNQNDTSEGFKTTPSIITGNQYGNYLDERGTLWYWGSRFRVQGAEASEPFPSDAKDLPSKFTGVENIKGIIKSYTMNGGIIKEDGSVWVWGSNEFGQWGTGQVSSENRTIDEMIKVEGLENIKTAFIGELSLAVKEDGTVWTWGRDSDTSTGHLSPHKVRQVEGLTDIIQVASGQWFASALSKDGTVWSWGSNVDSRLGKGVRELGTSFGLSTGEAAPYPVIENIKKIELGNAETLALGNDGLVYGWGPEENGIVPDPDYSNITTSPKPIAG